MDTNDERPRIRDLGVTPGKMQTGDLNAITDVAGVRVGHVTLIEGDDVRTGVTAILPHGGNVFREKSPAAVYVGNGFGKAAGFLQVRELGEIESPIVLTNTLSVGAAVEATVAWTLARPGNERVRSVNAVVGETNDGRLNDIRGMHITREHVTDAIDRAAASPARAPVEEGAVGAGTGTVCFGWKGGIGTSSRQLPQDRGGWTVGVLVQSNFGGNLTINGSRITRELLERGGRDEHEREDQSRAPADESDPSPDGSCMIVVATDAPLDSRNLERLAKRAVLGLGRTGSFMSNGSGDFVIAFSTANRRPHDADSPTQTIDVLGNDRMSPLFQAVVEATEEAVYNSLTKATTVTGRNGRTVEAIPVERLREALGGGH